MEIYNIMGKKRSLREVFLIEELETPELRGYEKPLNNAMKNVFDGMSKVSNIMSYLAQRSKNPMIKKKATENLQWILKQEKLWNQIVDELVVMDEKMKGGPKHELPVAPGAKRVA